MASYQFETTTPQVISYEGLPRDRPVGVKPKPKVVREITTIKGGRRASPEAALESLRKAEQAAKAAEQKAQEEAKRNAEALRIKEQQKKYIEDLKEEAKRRNQEIQVRYAQARKDEIYNPALNAYVSKSEPSGQGTAYIRPPTPQERIKIEEAEYKGSYKGMKEKVIEKAEEIKYSPFFTSVREKVKPTAEKLDKFEKENIRGKSGDVEKFPGMQFFNFAAEKTVKAGEFISKKTEPLARKVFGDDSLLFKEVPISRKQKIDIISTLYKGAAFSPFMETGTYQQSVYAGETVKVVYKGKLTTMTKAEAKALGLKPITRGQELEALENYLRVGKSGGFSSKADKLRDLLRRATTQEQRSAILKTAKTTYGDDFVKDFISQEYGGVVSTPAIKPSAVPKPTAPTPKGNIFIETPASKMTGAGYLTGTSSILDSDKVGETNWVDTKTDSSFFNDTKTDTNQKSGNIPLIDVKTKSDLRTQQKTKQDQRTSQDTLQTPKIIPDLAFSPKLDTKTQQEFRQPTQQKGEYFRPPRPLKKPRVPRIPLPKPLSLPKRLLKKVEEDSFEVFTLFKGKEKRIGKAKTKLGAEKLLGKELRGKLRASGFIEKGGQKIKASKLKLLQTGEFRIGKKDPTLLVEKKSKRLRKGTTGKQIQYFKKKSKTKLRFI